MHFLRTLHIYVYICIYTCTYIYICSPILGEGSIPRSYFRLGVVGNNSNIDCQTVQTEKLWTTLPDNGFVSNAGIRNGGRNSILIGATRGREEYEAKREEGEKEDTREAEKLRVARREAREDDGVEMMRRTGAADSWWR